MAVNLCRTCSWADGDAIYNPSIDSIGEMRRDQHGDWTLIRLVPKDKKETHKFWGDKF